MASLWPPSARARAQCLEAARLVRVVSDGAISFAPNTGLLVAKGLRRVGKFRNTAREDHGRLAPTMIFEEDRTFGKVFGTCSPSPGIPRRGTRWEGGSHADQAL
jgi:hypothetical protein